ncbi:hypothetical protein H634G_00676 [Metarhizium anisopliae BRIP 53293]|uniref:LEA domain-containing protein n=1 Tax=Metarhizium anisopliae BRIP 53293 TaxID=1291518 RepID=A0A0D9PDC2_METAN|nr:hypothetical protein H634G_00676 [Metarhizium anisopliae BRIP 53293]KJK94516.1 hypothetical protein H633G_01599 [Metarhizium anisopliae BRIP 53284]
MSFLAERAVRSAVPMCRTIMVQAPRAFSTSVAMRKNPTETVKDGLKTVDRTVTDNVVLPGLEAAASAGSKIKQGAETVAQGTKGKAAEMEGKAEELKGKAKGAAAEAEGKAKGTVEKMKNQL